MVTPAPRRGAGIGLWRLAAFLATLLAILLIALWPQPVVLPLPEVWQHILAFAALTALSGAANHRSLSIVHFAIAVGIGAAIEALQWAFTPRHAEWRDLAADAAGAALVMLIAALRNCRRA